MYPSHARAHVTAHDAVMACVARRHCSGFALAQTVLFISVLCECISDIHCSTSQLPGSPTMPISITPQAVARHSKVWALPTSPGRTESTCYREHHGSLHALVAAMCHSAAYVMSSFT